MASSKPFHVYWHNSIVLVFKFDNLGATAARMWGKHSLKYNGRMPEPLRILYDFVDCGPPSPYWIKNQNIIIPQLTLPKDIRNAYLIANKGYRVWTEAVLNRTPIDVGPLRTFLDRDEAIAWLMEGIATESEKGDSS